MKQLSVIKMNRRGMTINLDPDAPMQDVLAELEEKFRKNSRFFGTENILLTLRGREMTPREELAVVNVLSTCSNLTVIALKDDDGKEKEETENALKRRYMELHGITAVFHSGTVPENGIVSESSGVIIVGDVLKGGIVESSGSIVVLGELQGTAKAGCMGNREAVIVCFTLSSDDISVDGVRPRRQGGIFRFNTGPQAAFIENDVLKVVPVKKNIPEVLGGKSCWK